VAADERARLVGAAWTVLQRSGFEGFKVQLVIREAGLSARAFYRHFADKDELLLALLRDEMARAGARLTTAVSGVDDPLERVETWIRRIISAADDPRRVARARLFSTQQAVMRRYPREVEESVGLLVAPLREAIAAGLAGGVFPWAEPGRDARLIYALAGTAMTTALAEHPGRRVDEIVAETIGFALRALGVGPA